MFFCFYSGFFFISGCGFSTSESTDLVSGARTVGDGLECNDIVMEINGIPEKRKVFEYGEKLDLIFNDFDGFELKNGKHFPILSALILRDGKDTALFSENLLDNYQEGTDLNPLQLNAFFLLSFPYQNGEKYELQIVIKDAIGTGIFRYTQPFTIRRNDLLSVKTEGYSYSNVYLWNMSKETSVFSGVMDMKDQYAIMLEGLRSELRIGETVYPILSVELMDAEGVIVLADNNLLIHYEDSGVLYEDVFLEKLPITLSFNEGEVSNPCSLKLTLYEPGSSRKMEVNGEIVLK
ncbi:MAG: hypothetical protein SGI87_14410 [Flavobacteriales bacterium]|nr:hypothetical protein [Flavobacteriales bacterium]